MDQQSQATRSRDCQIVCLHPPKEFSVSDLARSLAELGVQSQTSLRLRHTQASAGIHHHVHMLTPAILDVHYLARLDKQVQGLLEAVLLGISLVHEFAQ